MLNVLGANKLDVPNRPPGFDPSHLALKGGAVCQLSAVCLNGNFVDVTSGKKGTINGSPTAGIDSPLGPNLSFAAGTYTTFSGRNSTNFASSTIAVTCRYSSISTNQYLFSSTSNSAGVSLDVDGFSTLQWVMFGVVAESSGLSLTAGVPYFIVCSQNGATGINYLVMDLRNGKIRTATSASSTPGAPNGTYVVGASPALGASSLARESAVAFISGYLPMPVMQAWAADPWSFWYPPNTAPWPETLFLGSNAVSVSFRSAWARNRNWISGGVAT